MPTGWLPDARHDPRMRAAFEDDPVVESRVDHRRPPRWFVRHHQPDSPAEADQANDHQAEAA